MQEGRRGWGAQSPKRKTCYPSWRALQAQLLITELILPCAPAESLPVPQPYSYTPL